MKPRDLSVIVIRAFAVWLLFQGIAMLEQIPIGYFNPIGGSDAFTRYVSILNFINLILYTSLGLGLLLRVDWAANLLVRGIESEGQLQIGMQDLAVISFSVAGIFVFVDGLEKAIHQIITYYVKPGTEFAGQLIKADFNAGMFLSGLTKIVLGLVLIFSPSGILRAIRWTRGGGTA